MIRLDLQKWGQSLSDLRWLALHAPHPRTRERFLALAQIADGTHNATTWAAQFGRQDETVLAWVHRYNQRGPDSVTYRRTGSRPPFFRPTQAERIVETVRDSEPIDHGLPGHGWTLKKLRQWIEATLGRQVGRNAIRRILGQAGLTWKKIKKLLGQANAQARADHIVALERLFEQVRSESVSLISIDESHFHPDLDGGYTGSEKGKPAWRRSTSPGHSRRLDWYGAYDFRHGRCLIREDGHCDGLRTCQFLDQVARWHGRGAGRIVVIWDNASWHTSALVREHAEMLGIELLALPTYSPDLNPIEGLWAWMREEVTRGHCHASLKALRVACQEFIARINEDAVAVVDRLWPKFELDPEHEAKLLVST